MKNQKDSQACARSKLKKNNIASNKKKTYQILRSLNLIKFSNLISVTSLITRNYNRLTTESVVEL